jgi:hypothetical protein
MFDQLEAADRAKAESLIKAGAQNSKDLAAVAQDELLAAVVEPIRQGVITGDIIGGIFTPEVLQPGSSAKFPIDFYRTDNANDYVAYVAPAHGKVSYAVVEGDEVTIPTFRVNNSIDIPLHYLRDVRWSILSRAMEVLEAGFVKKFNDDGWHVILKAAADRNVVVYDSAAGAGEFTKRLVTSLKTVMARNGGGNSSSMNKAALTHLYTSLEAIDDVRNWGIGQIDEITRNQIYNMGDGDAVRIFGTNIVGLFELGENQVYQNFYDDVIGGSMGGSDVEIAIGLDLSRKDSFVMPIREQVSIFSDPTRHREGFASWYGHGEQGYGVLDGRRTLIGSL